METMERKVLVTGATGRQGGAVARHLATIGWSVRAFARNPDSEAAVALADAGMEVVQGDMEDRASLDRAMEGVHGVFSVQNFWESGAEREIIQGKNVADAAKDAEVEHFIYTSVGGADRNTGIIHFESKWEIENHIRALGLPNTIFRPVFFMDNLLGMMDQIEQGTLAFGLPSDTPLQMIATDDIGAFVAMAFQRRDEFLGKAYEIAGDELTMPRAANTFAHIIGRPVNYVELPLSEVDKQSHETAVMLEWFIRKGYEADISMLRRMYPGLKTFEDWARHTIQLRV